MKKLTYSFFIAAALCITACDKKLDVTPQQNITPEQITTASDVKALLFGEYSLYQSFNGYGERLKFVPDLLASQGQLDFVGTFTNYKDVYNKQQVVSNSIASGIWSNGYRIINLTNTVLSKIDLIDESERDAITGEAEFMRGTILFEMVNLFAKTYTDGDAAQNPGVPISLTAPQYIYDSTSALLPRSTVQQVYTQVLSDLQDAANKLPEANDNARVTKYTAEAILSRVYMMMRDYENAANAANDVINSGYYNLVSTYNQAFNNVGNSTEDIWGIQQTAQSNAGVSNNGMPTFYATYPTGRGDAQVSADFPGI
ncbi:MAG: RagB/SusD family nutrient uptake outer membrane protein, partial [Williamsia sp.]|nr:RagB/SusD family nutrient uptake outer membrane protein [Williamsia sp.]